jgi:5-methylthioadenosine/S-adenosylhomocysteine deaminase
MLIGHAVFTNAHAWSVYPFADDIADLVDTGATVGHCPYKYAKMAMVLQSFDKYRAAGVNLALGTDTYPMDIVAEMRWAATLARVTDGNYQAGAPRDVFNAATLGACKFLRRDDLGRLAPGAKADVLLIRLNDMGIPPFRDPIKALVEYGTGRDVDTVIVDGTVRIQGGRAVSLDENAIREKAARAVAGYWSHIPGWHWAGKGVDQMIPPAFPLHRTPER